MERIEARGLPVPDHLVPPPVLPGYDGWVSDFYELSTDRTVGMGIGPIPAASIDRHTASWSPCEAALFRRVIRALDAVYLRHVRGEGDDNPMAARDAFRAAMKGPT